ncbi:hypothetical protein QBC44DRAFT_397649 [Cladorrhinum sp. PSN332]|nr:hypothetical protein QBC44DRAFT_397649 [Cladorrhinum sp. PSN332]
MRLLNTTTFKITSYLNHTQAPPYAILSHTWSPDEDDEVTFQDLTSPGSARTYQRKKGWRKIAQACRYANAYGWHYIWIDTCCINKTDATELCDALNSTYSWYEAADVCYAYLEDVPALPTAASNGSGIKAWKNRFRGSRWFTRGWTLQELLAPTFLEFVDQEWTPIGTREEWAGEVMLATGIGLRDMTGFRECSVGTKLSWAANRQTARVEDRAYSLLGLLGVKMPLVYGEGEYAFTRLLLEVIRRYDDESIFVWRDTCQHKEGLDPFEAAFRRSLLTMRSSPVLAPSPECFRHSKGLTTHRFDTNRRGFTMTNAGLDMTAELFQLGGGRGPSPMYLIRLNCCWESGDESTATPVGDPLAFLLRQSEPDTDDLGKIPTFFRKSHHRPTTWAEAWEVYGKFFSLGKRNIVILDHDTPLSPVAPRNETLSFKLCVTLPLNMAAWAYTAQRRSTGSWDIESTDVLCKHISTLGKGAAYICRAKPKDGTLISSASFTVIIKWRRGSLSCGIWNMAWVTNQDLTNLLDSDEDRPYPLVAPLPSDLRLGLVQQEMAVKVRVVSESIGDGHQALPSEPMKLFVVDIFHREVEDPEVGLDTYLEAGGPVGARSASQAEEVQSPLGPSSFWETRLSKTKRMGEIKRAHFLKPKTVTASDDELNVHPKKGHLMRRWSGGSQELPTINEVTAKLDDATLSNREDTFLLGKND